MSNLPTERGAKMMTATAETTTVPTKLTTTEALAAELYRIAQGVVDPQGAARECLAHYGWPAPAEQTASYTLLEVAEMLERYAECCVDPYKTHHGYAAATLREMAGGQDGFGVLAWQRNRVPVGATPGYPEVPQL